MKKACRINGTPSEEKNFQVVGIQEGVEKDKGGRKLIFLIKKEQMYPNPEKYKYPGIVMYKDIKQIQ